MQIVKKYRWQLLSFFSSLLILTVFFALLGSFTDKVILNGDMRTQYVSLFQYLRDVIHGNANFPYSFTKDLGGGMYGACFYYISSPLNLFVYFFKDIPFFLLLLVIVKLSLCGLTMNIYLSNKFKKNNWTILLFSLAYVLMGYNINYHSNLMWLEGVLLAPLILLGIDRIIDGKKDWLYIIPLFITIISNFYIGYILCVFSVIYFAYMLFLKYDYKKNKKIMIGRSLHFLLITMFVGFMCIFILLPTILDVSNSMRLFSLGDVPAINMNFFNYFAPLYIGFGNLVNPLNFYGFNIYCGLFMTLLVILFFTNSKISRKEKRLTLIVYFVLLLPITFSYLNFIWHAFSIPGFFGYRYSFLATLFTLYIALKSYLNLEVHKKPLVIFGVIFLIISVALSYLTLSVPDYYIYLNWEKILLTLLIMLVYMVLLLKGKKRLLLCIVFLELILNLAVIGHESSFTPKSDYERGLSNAKLLDSYCTDKRCGTVFSYTLTDGMLGNYNESATFLSTTNKRIITFWYQIHGQASYPNYYFYLSPNHVFDMLVGVEYIMSDKRFHDYETIETFDQMHLVRNKRALSLGYLVSNRALTLETDKTGLFYQEELLNAITDENNSYFIEIPIQQTDELTYQAYIDVNSSYVFIVGKEVPSSINGEKERYCAYASESYCALYNKYSGEPITLKYEEKQEDVRIYYIDENQLNEFYEAISAHELDVSVNTGQYIKGSIYVPEKSVLLLTIPVEKGWSVKVDGKSTQYHEIFRTFIGIELDEGDHLIELNYRVRGLIPGIIISLLSAGGFICYEILFKKRLMKCFNMKNVL